MLRRKQVMISDWLDDFLHAASKRYKLSYSEIIRIATCHHMISVICERDPKFKMLTTTKQVAKNMKAYCKGTAGEVETRKMIADIYLEAKKILDIRLKEINKELE